MKYDKPGSSKITIDENKPVLCIKITMRDFAIMFASENADMFEVSFHNSF
jgi:hypothetical protein